MTTINIFIEQGEGIDVDFAAWVRGIKPKGGYNPFNGPECGEIVWDKHAFTPEEDAIIRQYLNDNYDTIERAIIAEACKPVNPYQITPLH